MMDDWISNVTPQEDAAAPIQKAVFTAYGGVVPFQVLN